MIFCFTSTYLLRKLSFFSILTPTMKISLINNLYKPYTRGGAGRAVEHKAEKLKEQGHDVVVISWKPWSGFRSWQPEVSIEDGIKVYRFWAPNIFSYKNLADHNIILRSLWNIFDIFNIFSAKIIENILKQENPDLVNTHNIKGMGFLLPKVIDGMDIKHTHTLHDVQLVEPSGRLPWNHTKDSLFQRIYSFITKKLFGSPDKIISPSYYLKDFYQERGFFSESDWEVEKFQLKQKTNKTKELKNPTKFIFVGNLEEYKGVDKLMQAWEKVSNKDKELHIVGSGSYEPKLKRWSDQSNNVKVYGRLKKEEVAEKYKECDVLIFPSICIENSPNVIKEALEYNLKVLAAETGGVVEFSNYNVEFFEPGSVEEMIKKIETVV